MSICSRSMHPLSSDHPRLLGHYIQSWEPRQAGFPLVLVEGVRLSPERVYKPVSAWGAIQAPWSWTCFLLQARNPGHYITFTRASPQGWRISVSIGTLFPWHRILASRDQALTPSLPQRFIGCFTTSRAGYPSWSLRRCSLPCVIYLYNYKLDPIISWVITAY